MSFKHEEATRKLQHDEERLRELKREYDLLKQKFEAKEREVREREHTVESDKKKLEEAAQEDKHEVERKKQVEKEHQGREKQGPEKREGLSNIFDKL